MMISFKNKEELYTDNTFTPQEYADISEITEAFEDVDVGTEALFSAVRGTLIIRYFSKDLGYYFSPPYAISDEADVENAFKDITDYCIREEIPEVIVDLLPEELPLALRGAAQYETDEAEDGTFMVRINTECMLCDELPEAMFGDVYLGEFALSYAKEYEKLVKNENLNLHYGYNICEDIPNGNGEDFIKAIRDDFERGVSMSFAATVLADGENVFVGEGCLYGFDGRGGASASLRVLPEYHRRGIGRSVLRCLMKTAAEIGLSHLFAEIKEENLPSLAMVNGIGREIERNNGVIKFLFEI